MSVANTLPLLIIQGIVRQLVVNANQSSDFKDSLRLLTISRSWREFAKPLVYKCVYFNLASPISSGFNCDMDSKYTRVSAGQTNIGLVKALKVSRLAKSITINITDMSSNADDFIDNAHKFFDYKNCDWQNIREFSIYVRVNTTGTNVIETDARQKVIENAKKFSRAIPNIKRMKVYMNLPNRTFVFIEYLVKTYASQLKTCVLQPFGYFVSSLANMESMQRIKVKPDLLRNRQDPFLNPECLTHLELVDNRSADMWISHLLAQSLHTKSRAVYPNLKNLVLAAYDSAFQPHLLERAFSLHPDQSISFPTLQRLEIMFSSLEGLINTLCNNVCTWPAITSISLIMHPFCNCNLSKDDINEYLNSMYTILAKTMPLLKSVDIESRAGSLLTSTLQDCLVDCFGSVVTHFSSCKPLSIKSPAVMTNLVNLKIVANKITILQLISANCKTLKILIMLNVPQNFTWGLLNSGTNGILKFSMLESLTIYFTAVSHELWESFSTFDSTILTCSKGNNNKVTRPEKTILCPQIHEIKIFPENYDSVFNTLADNIIDISRTKKLRITLNTSQNNDRNISNTDIISKLGKAIWQTMPNITHLVLEGKKNIGTKLFDVINQLYSRQLKQLISSTEMLSKMHFSLNLKSLTLYNSQQQQTPLAINQPAICTRNLEEIDLALCSNHYSWNWFSDPRCAGKINFGVLKLFKVKISCNNQADKVASGRLDNRHMVNSKPCLPIDIFMPKITSFHMELTNPQMDSIPSQIHFSIIDYVKITGPVGTLPICASKESTVTKYQDITITHASLKDKDYFYSFTNSWFGNKQPLNSSSLTISDIDFSIELEHVNWKYADNIICNFGLDAQTLFEMLPKLPNIDNLAVNNFLINDSINYLLALSQKSFVKPLSTSLKTLRLRFTDCMANKNYSCFSICYLILALPFLEYISIFGIRFDSKRFVAEYSEKYPHITSTNIVVIDD